jgi:hypothetical protein
MVMTYHPAELVTLVALAWASGAFMGAAIERHRATGETRDRERMRRAAERHQPQHRREQP